jgi:hypothetical protein
MSLLSGRMLSQGRSKTIHLNHGIATIPHKIHRRPRAGDLTGVLSPDTCTATPCCLTQPTSS